MFKVLATSKSFGVLSDSDFKYFEEQGYEIVKNPKPGVMPTKEELIALIPEIDGIVIGNEIFDKDVMDAARNLKVIAKFGVGVDNIDLDEAKKHGIKVTNVRGANAISVAEHAFALMLDISKMVTYSCNKIKKGVWESEHADDVFGKTVGIVGFGKIGQEFAKRAKAFGMKILAYDTFKNETVAKELGVKYVGIDELTKNSDYITLHCPKTAENENLFDAKRMRMMKKGSFLINTARGGLVDEDALYDALKSGHVAGAAFDVLSIEPPKRIPRLFECENFVCTAHCAGVSKDAVQKVVKITSENIIAVLEGKECRNIVF